MINDKGLLFIEPKNSASEKPLIDAATKKMTTALRKVKDRVGMLNGNTGGWLEGLSTKGFHLCTGCKKAISSNHDYLLNGGLITNSLAIHYLAFHRDEVSDDQLEKVLGLTDGEEVPSENELQGNVWA